MTSRRSVGMLLALLLGCVSAAGHVAAAPPQPGGSDTPYYHDPCENIGKYFNADYDRDGLSGYQECQLGSDPKDTDTDNDGLTDDTEVSLGSDLSLWDTDGDQLSDCWEWAKALDGWPTDHYAAGFDADGDGISDALEIQVGLNPGNIDTDQDLLCDGEESLP